MLVSRPNVESQAVREDVNSVIQKVIEEGELEAFNVIDIGEVDRRLAQWKKNLPGVTPFYAVKALPDQRLIQRMADLGMGFDCASPFEIELVLAAGVHPDRIIFANPCKLKSHMRHACQNGVKMNTFDSENELDKIKQLWPTSQLFLRIWADDSSSSIPLSSKYGASLADVPAILQKAKLLNLDVVGVSFHVGSNCLAPGPFSKSILTAKEVFRQAEALGFNMTTLNIGGGMPGKEGDAEFEMASAAIRAGITENFPDGVRVIAEPGRYFSSPTLTCACSIIGKRVRNQVREYFITQSAFGIFAEGIFPQKVEYTPIPLTQKGAPYNHNSPLYKTVMWGPTCTSQDTINLHPTLRFPDLEIGDWFYVENVGSYSLSKGFTFNGIGQYPIYYIDTSSNKLTKN